MKRDWEGLRGLALSDEPSSSGTRSGALLAACRLLGNTLGIEIGIDWGGGATSEGESCLR